MIVCVCMCAWIYSHRLYRAVLSPFCHHTCCTRWSKAEWTCPASPTPERWPKPPYSRRTSASWKWEKQRWKRKREILKLWLRWGVMVSPELQTQSQAFSKLCRGDHSIFLPISQCLSSLPSTSTPPAVLHLSIFSTPPSVLPLVCLSDCLLALISQLVISATPHSARASKLELCIVGFLSYITPKEKM